MLTLSYATVPAGGQVGQPRIFDTTLASGIPIVVSGAVNSTGFGHISVPTGSPVLQVTLHGGTGDADLYVYAPGGALAASSVSQGNEETAVVPAAASGTYNIAVAGYADFANVTLTATVFTPQVLTPGAPVTFSGQQGAVQYGDINVPASSTILQVALRGGTGDADLALFSPDGTAYGVSFQDATNNETLSVAAPLAGHWAIQVIAYRNFSGAALSAALLTPQLLAANAATGTLSGAASSETFYRVRVPNGASSLTVATTGGDGDVDLYVRFGNPAVCQVNPNVEQPCLYDKFSTRVGNVESVTFNAPAAGDYYIDLLGYAAYSGVTLSTTVVGGTTTASLTVAPASLTFTAQEGGVQVAQTLSISGTMAGYSWTAQAATSGSSWLALSRTSGTGDGSLTATVNPAPLARGTYSGSIIVTAAGLAGSPQTISVTLTVTPAGSGGGGGGANGNLAQGKIATQSSTLPGYPGAIAASAVDGNTGGNFMNGSVTATNYENNPWWQVDLGASASIGSLVVWNRTDCCASRLGDYWVFVSDTPFLATDTPATLQFRPGTFSLRITTAPAPSATLPAVAQGRYLRIQLTGADYLSLAEVQVFAASNPGKTATQSSTLPGTPSAAAAIDGSTDGSFFNNSVTATNFENSPWWQVDLGTSTPVGSIVIWNRTDCCGSRLGDYWVFVSDTPFLASDTPANLQSRPGTWSRHLTSPPSPSTAITAGTQGRYLRVQLSGADYLSLAEVQVFAASNPGKTATQSSTLPGTPSAAAAIDGSTDGSFFNNSVTATNFENSPWWQVDLGASTPVGSIVIWNRTDCCGSRLGDYWVFVSDTPFLATDTPATLQSRPGTWSSHQTTAPSPSTTIPAAAQGRYLRVQLTGAGYLSLAEVQVFVASNPGKTATQSSTLPGTPSAAAAIDGSTDGSFFNNSVTATNFENSPWWQVDLGASTPVGSIVIWNRTDCCGSRLGDYWVFVSDTPFLAADTPATLQSRPGTWSSHQTTAPSPSATIPAVTQGRYVRVQLTGANYLSLAEVQVFAQ